MKKLTRAHKTKDEKRRLLLTKKNVKQETRIAKYGSDSVRSERYEPPVHRRLHGTGVRDQLHGGGDQLCDEGGGRNVC